jgi:hypothetical protein
MPSRGPSRLIAYALIAGFVVSAMVFTIVSSRIEAGRSYVLFDWTNMDQHGRLDGKDIGILKKRSALRMAPGGHKFEIVDAQSGLVASTTADVPAAGWRGVFSSVVPEVGYAVVTVWYDGRTPPKIRMLQKRGAGLHTIDDGSVSTRELEELGMNFPTTGTKSMTVTRLCRVDATGQLECLN